MDKTIDIGVQRGPHPLPLHLMLPTLAGGGAPKSYVAMVAGVQKYQAHPFHRSVSPLPCVWQLGAVRLLYCAAKRSTVKKEGAVCGPIFLVPSLINKSDIFDISQERSFVRWLSAQGRDVYILDWGDSVADDAQQSIEDLIYKCLAPAICFVAKKCGQKIHAIGYCMGGTILAATAALGTVQEHLSSLCFLATPWDFHAGDRVLANQIILGQGAALQMMEADGVLPVRWLQSVFAVVNADKVMQKFSNFYALNDGAQEHLFVAVEDWLNEGRDLSAGIARCSILDWYVKNKPGKGTWSIAGEIVNLTVIKIPSLVVAPQKDRLVPVESALSMAQQLSGREVLQPDCGHVGLMTGRRAEEFVWSPMSAWFSKNDL